MGSNSTETLLRDLVNEGAIPPFVYSYPTRSSYRELDPQLNIERIWQEDEKLSPCHDLNLYIHVPFCRYKCGFCNLYTVLSKEQSVYDAYTEALCLQLEASRSILERRNLRTIYIGGGTPSLLSPQNFDMLFAKITQIYPNWRSVVEEVAIEATPDSIVDPQRPNIVAHLMALGLTRINIGVQSLKKEELKEAGRMRAGTDIIREAIHLIKEQKLPNLSTDLIMGFFGQTDETWVESVKELVALQPETISTYFLTVRPDAWFSKTGKYVYQNDPHLYFRYDLAREILLEAGYIQESNVRYKIPGRGGYRQKALYFHGIPVLGIGVGARSGTYAVDYVIGGYRQSNISQVYQYIKDVRNKAPLLSSGIELTDDERIRKRLVLDLFDLDLRDLAPYNIEKHLHLYEDVLNAALNQGLLRKVGQSRYQLTMKGYKYRDILSWMLFSDDIRQKDREFYAQLHQQNKRAVAMIDAPEVMTSPAGIRQGLHSRE